MLSQRSLEAFRAVIECGTVSGAAENLHVSQPAGSRLIKDLEDRTGLQLFTRFGGKIVPTPEARALYAQGYSLQSLRKQCYRAATWDKHHDRYEGVKIVFRALTHGQPALALPALGGLFAEDRLPHLETARLISGSLQPRGPSLAALSAEIAALPTPLRADHPFFQSWHHCERPVPSDFLNWLAASAAQMRRRDWLACLQTLESANLIREADRLRMPTLVLSGDKDPIFDTSHQARLAASLPKASHLRYADLGHNLHWEAPIEVAKELSAFFQI